MCSISHQGYAALTQRGRARSGYGVRLGDRRHDALGYGVDRAKTMGRVGGWISEPRFVVGADLYKAALWIVAADPTTYLALCRGDSEMATSLTVGRGRDARAI